MDSKVEIGKSLTMWATLPSNGSTIDIVKCQWTSPFGVTYNVEKNEVKSVGGKGPFQFMYSIGRFPEPLISSHYASYPLDFHRKTVIKE